MATKKKQPAKKTVSSSLKKADAATPFLTVRFTQQTVYWLVLSILVLALGIWVMYLTLKVQRIYDEIDSANIRNSFVEPLRNK